MSLLNETQNLERRRFFNYERLLDTDLNDQDTFQRQMRWMHNQSLHQPGVGNGYKVTGNKGDRSVTIGAGYALDVDGREIVMVRETTLAVPPVADDGYGRPVLYYLTVSYPDDAGLIQTEYRQGVCASSGAVRLAERPNLCWVALRADDQANPKTYLPQDPTLSTAIAQGRLIVLVMVGVYQCKLIDDLVGRWLAPRRSAQPPALPYTASGVQESPNWIPTMLDGLGLDVDPTNFPTWLLAPFSLGTTVFLPNDVMFGAIPRYLVRVTGDRVFGAVPKEKKENEAVPQVYIEPVVDLDLGQSDHIRVAISVTLMVWVKDNETWQAAKKGSLFKPSETDLDALARVFSKRWQIVWVGIEG